MQISQQECLSPGTGCLLAFKEIVDFESSREKDPEQPVLAIGLEQNIGLQAFRGPFQAKLFHDSRLLPVYVNICSKSIDMFCC